MNPISPQAKINRRIGIVSLIALIFLAIYSWSNFTPVTVSGSENDSFYQFIIFTMTFLTGLAVIFVIGIAVGISSFINSPNISHRIGGTGLVIFGIALLILSYTVPRGGESLIAIQTVPVSLLYIGIGAYMALKKQK